MSESIIVALITGVLALAGVVYTNRKSTSDLFAKLDKQSEINDQKLDAKLSMFQAVTETKIDNLTKKVEKHNQLIERVYSLEGRVTAVEHEIDDVKGRAS